MGRRIDEERINTEVNACLRLGEIPGFAPGDGPARRIRALLLNDRSDALDSLDEWRRSSPMEAKKLFQLLAKIAASGRLPELATIKKVGRKQLIQIDGHKNARLYCFEDGPTLVICVSGFWVGRGNKKTHQDEAIHDAERLMGLWKNALPIDAGGRDD